MKLITLALAGLLATGAAAKAENFSFAYFMGPGHILNKALFTPYAEKLAEVSDGELTVQQFAGGGLNSAPPKQYSILLQGVADMVFTLPGYTGDLFPVTNTITLPDVCDNAVACTEALWRVKDLVEKEYDAKVLALWANAPPVLFTRDRKVTRVEDMAGLKVRNASSQDVPFTTALGASALAQPVSVINQNLTNGVVDAVAVDPTAVQSFKLHEPANYMTTWYTGSGSAMIMLMNRSVYDGLSDQKKAWIDQVSTKEMSLRGAKIFDELSAKAFAMARDSGVEIVEITPKERDRFRAAIAPAMQEVRAGKAGGRSVGEIIDLMKGQ